MPPTPHWDIFCRVIDNFGDIGTCWRLAADLATRGDAVRLWVDDASALAWMAPGGHAGVQVARFDDAATAEPGGVVVEAFGCDPPAGFVERMAARVGSGAAAPVWINLEYLSAEAWVARSHGLPSPQRNGLTKWFFFPGFTAGTGGLIREPDLAQRQREFDGARWLASIGVERRPGERVVSLFCYDGAPLPALLERLASAPTLLLAAAGTPSRMVAAQLGASLSRGALRALLLPPLPQPGFDHLLWASDLNFVRGEDSFVRAQHAGRPFVWQIYPQADGAHAAKLQAFIDRFDGGRWQPFWRAWNGLTPPLPELPSVQELAPWRAHCERWRERLLGQADLVSELRRFADERR